MDGWIDGFKILKVADCQSDNLKQFFLSIFKNESSCVTDRRSCAVTHWALHHVSQQVN